MSDPLLEVRDLHKHYDQNRSLVDAVLRRSDPPIRAVDGVSLSLSENEVEGVIGESGCGKTTLLTTLLALEDRTGGEIRFRGRDVDEFSRSDWREFRRSVQVVFQDPFDSLDPKLTVEETLAAPLSVHGMGDRDERIHSVLEDVELRPPERYLDRFPRQLSGGEKQRVSIARALVLEPDVLLADEPVSMLDVSTQSVVLNLLSGLIEDRGLSMLYISHDLSTVGYVCDAVNVMYLGRIVESAPTMELLSDPKHPYSAELIRAIPVPDPHVDRERTSLQGSTPDPVDLGEGCRFRDRCPDRMEVCEHTPEHVGVGADHSVACHLYYDHEAGTADGAADGGDDEAAPGEAATDGGEPR